ncbi:MAG: hypothetical protein AAF191_02990 [Verrucomicrobiota bacterium]
MSKGCLIALVVGLVLVLACCGGGLFFSFQYNTSQTLAFLEQGIEDYQDLYPEREVELTNEAWYAALTADDCEIPNQTTIAMIGQLGEMLSEVEGQFVDIYKTPIKLEIDELGLVRAYSAGRDREFGTDDDETSEKFLKLFER